jgi:predicted nucleic acid-binding protein
MAVFYLDTSAALKRYKTEKGTDVVNELYQGPRAEHPLCTSHLTALEVESAAVRRAVHTNILHLRARVVVITAEAVSRRRTAPNPHGG